jgi:hypothetical protein
MIKLGIYYSLYFYRNNITKRYSVIYYHGMSNNLTPFVFIRDTFKKLPIQYYALLDKIYVV